MPRLIADASFTICFLLGILTEVIKLAVTHLSNTGLTGVSYANMATVSVCFVISLSGSVMRAKLVEAHLERHSRSMLDL